MDDHHESGPGKVQPGLFFIKGLETLHWAFPSGKTKGIQWKRMGFRAKPDLSLLFFPPLSCFVTFLNSCILFSFLLVLSIFFFAPASDKQG